jgi:hypothetical protein
MAMTKKPAPKKPMAPRKPTTGAKRLLSSPANATQVTRPKPPKAQATRPKPPTKKPEKMTPQDKAMKKILEGKYGKIYG